VEEESNVVNVKHHKAIVRETKAVKHTVTKKPAFQLKETAAPVEPISVIKVA
jgi:hypothetical protein